MENNNEIIDSTSQKGLLVDELVEGRDLTKQLYSILLKESSSSSSTIISNNEAQLPSLNVTQKILSKIERSLTILGYESTTVVQCNTMGTIDSPLSFSGTTTPISPDSESDFKDPIDSKDDSRKRKIIPRYTLKVEGCRKSGLEGPIEDGFSWRKYGQKDILGANYPRAYYRCTQRVQGCFATKQVQRSDNDPTYFEVTYRGKHTCYQASSSSSMPIPTPKPEPSNASPCPPPQEVFWSFETDPKDIKSSSFPPHFSSNHFGAIIQNTQNNNTINENDNVLFSPRARNNNSNDYNINSLDNASQFSFDQGELDPDFIFDNLHLFQ